MFPYLHNKPSYCVGQSGVFNPTPPPPTLERSSCNKIRRSESRTRQYSFPSLHNETFFKVGDKVWFPARPEKFTLLVFVCHFPISTMTHHFWLGTMQGSSPPKREVNKARKLTLLLFCFPIPYIYYDTPFHVGDNAGFSRNCPRSSSITFPGKLA